MNRRSGGARLPGAGPGSTAPPVPPAPLPPLPPLPPPELTEAECRRCGTLIAGLDGRYACGVCGWVNDHSEGHRRLPTADEDPDRPVRGRRRPPQRPGPAPDGVRAPAPAPGTKPGTGP